MLIVLGVAAQQDQLQALLHPPLEHALQLGETLTIGIREGIVKDQRQGAVIGLHQDFGHGQTQRPRQLFAHASTESPKVVGLVVLQQLQLLEAVFGIELQ